MQYTKKHLKEQLYQMGLNGTETILIHSSMKAIGDVEGGAETVLDAWMEYFKEGLLLLPTHTWKTVNESHPVFDSQKEPSCVGVLTNLFMKREGVVRSLHPTHSMAALVNMRQNTLQEKNTAIHRVRLAAVTTD